MLIVDQDKITYLSNVLVIVYTDNKISPRESAALEEIRKNIDAKKSHLTGAQKCVEGGSYHFAVVGSFADQVRNIEDMLFAAFSDSDLDANKEKLINEFSTLIGLHKEQIDKLISDTSRRCDQSNNSLTCAACATIVSAQARFCPSCGAPLAATEAAAAQEGYTIPQKGYALEFCESTAAGFPTALELGKSTGTLQTANRNKKSWYLVAFSQDRFADLIPIASSLTGMRNRRIYLDGQELRWDEVFGFVWCASQRSSAYRPVEYCFGKDDNRLNPWGCKQSRMDWTEWSNWFSFGKWEKSGFLKSTYTFVFDKQRIRHDLETSLYRFRFCPHMRTKLMEAVFSHFPEQAEVTSDGPWKYSRCYEQVPGCIKVTVKEEIGSSFYTSEYYSDGVRPRGHALYSEVLKKAIQDCTCSDVSVSNILA